MKKLFPIVLILLIFSLQSIVAQVYYGRDAANIINGSDIVRLSEKSSIPSFIKFRQGSEIEFASFESFLNKTFNISNALKLVKISSDKDDLGGQNIKYQQTNNNIPIHDAILLVNVNNGEVKFLSGTIYSSISVSNDVTISKNAALELALASLPADKYKWEIPGEEELIKEYKNNTEATYYPKAIQVLFSNSYPNYNKLYVATYKFSIYSHKPLFYKDIYINCETGEVVFTLDKLHMSDVLGTANTKYSGMREITTDSYNGSFRLRETGRGNGIETYDMNTGTSYNSAVDFTDADNYWNNYNSDFDEVAADAHWAAEMTYDYYYILHNRNSIDDNGFKLRNYVHYDFEYVNAFWDGNRMTFGDGEGSVTPLTSIDIVGHEITHGLTQHTANLDYAYESGAINEGFSDIFGTSIEFYGKPNDANWTVGEDIGMTMRSMSNPNLYGQPDTYLGTNWYFGSGDNGGVHYNNSIMNYWYYLLCDGGSGTNDIGNAYNVTSIGLIDAGKIAFRTLTVYLTNSSQYADARFYSIMAAIDLFGSCSSEVEAVTRAWYAVGIGPNYVNGVLSDFSGDFLEFCASPANVHFTNMSVNGMSFLWDFGDGTTSTSLNPYHTYSSLGNYTVSLIVDGGACGADTLTEVAYISIDPTNPCVAIMNQTGAFATQNSCSGTVYDSGGESNYQNSSNSSLTISPTGGLTVALTFQSFNFEDTFDFLYIYDGPTVSSPLIGQYSGTTLPNGGTIQSTGSSITLKQTSDIYVTESGFSATWQCDYANTAPVTDFMTINTESCGSIQFYDISNNGPTSWLWYFGDGTTNTTQNPSHTYPSDGIYSVSLVATNSFGTDSITFVDYIIISTSSIPTVSNQAICETESAELIAVGFGQKVWFTEQNNGELLATGDTFISPALTSTTQYWVEAYAFNQFAQDGKIDNSGGGGYFTGTNIHYLVFDCFTPTKLVSVKVYANSSGNRTIRLNNSNGIQIASKEIYVPMGENKIYLNFNIPVGTDFQLAGPGSPDMYRNNNGNNYPYELSGLVSVKHSSATSNPTGYYYYFYDWELMDVTCESERVSANILVNPLPQSDFNFVIDSGIVTFTNISTDAESFNWDFDDGETSSDEDPIHIYSQTGDYTVSLTTTNSCGSNTISYTFSITITDIDIIDRNTSFLDIFPNPNNGNFMVQFESSDIGQITIELYGLLGQKIYSELVNNFNGLYKHELNLSNNSAGIYYLKVKTDKANYIKKIVVK